MTQETIEEHLKYFLDARGVETPCERCRGLGTRTYGSTATWAGGVGGQVMTLDVCDACWGSGDANRLGVNLRRVRQTESGLRDLIKRLEEDLAMYRSMLSAKKK